MQAAPVVQIMSMRFSQPDNTGCDFRIDLGTPVGNPYAADHIAHSEKIRLYRELFLATLVHREDVQAYLLGMLTALREHGKIRLFCWCWPMPCHGEVIKTWLLTQYNKETSNENNAG